MLLVLILASLWVRASGLEGGREGGGRERAHLDKAGTICCASGSCWQRVLVADGGTDIAFQRTYVGREGERREKRIKNTKVLFSVHYSG